MSLVTTAEVRALISSGLSDSELQDVIDRVEDEITEEIGAPYTDDSTPITETVSGGGKSIYLKRPINSVSSVTEYSQLSNTAGTSLTENEEFYVWPDQGRLERIGGIWGGGEWGRMIEVVYVPQDQNKKRKKAIIDLVRLDLSRKAMYQESVGGEYSYTAPPNWEKESRQIMKRLVFTSL